VLRARAACACCVFVRQARAVCACGEHLRRARAACACGELVRRARAACACGGRVLLTQLDRLARTAGRARAVAEACGVQTQVCAACRHCRLTSQGTPCGVSGGRKLTSVDYQAGLDIPGRVISPAPMRTLTIVSASGPGPEWDVESDVGSTGPVPGRWLSDVPIVRGRACVITSTALPVGTRKSHNGTKRNVTLLASRLNKVSARPAAVARAVPNDESQLHIVHAYLVIMTMCHMAVVNRTCGFRSALAAASGSNMRRVRAACACGVRVRRARAASACGVRVRRARAACACGMRVRGARAARTAGPPGARNGARACRGGGALSAAAVLGG